MSKLPSRRKKSKVAQLYSGGEINEKDKPTEVNDSQLGIIDNTQKSERSIMTHELEEPADQVVDNLIDVLKEIGGSNDFELKLLPTNPDEQGKNRKLAGLENLDQNMSKFNDMTKNDSQVQNIAESSNLGMSVLNKLQKNNTYEDLRKVYIDNYGVQMEVPSYNFIDAKFIPKQQELYFVTLVHHIIPKMSTHNIQTTHYEDRSVIEESYEDIYQMTGEDLVLGLKQVEGRNVKTVREIQLKGVKSAILKFSRSGDLFAIYNQNKNVLSIYDSTDILDCFDQIEKETPFLNLEFYDQLQAQKLHFDIRDKSIAILTDKQILMHSLEQESFGEQILNYQIDTDLYTQILDIEIDSDQDKIEIACQTNSLTTVKIFDIGTTSNFKSISFNQDKGNLKVKISENSCFLSIGHENYIFKDGRQSYYPFVKDKFIRDIVPNGDEFFLLATKDYDRDIDILRTQDNDSYAWFNRNIEPNILKVFDAYIEDDQLKMLTMLDNAVYFDSIVLDENNKVQTTAIDQGNHAFSFNWPYFSYATFDQQIIILNAFNKTFIQRYTLPSSVSRVVKTFLTDTHDFYCLVETNDYFFEIYELNLDSPDPFIDEAIFSYPFDDVNSKQAIAFHVRGSTEKEQINQQKHLMCFMLHENELWAWNGTQVVQKISDSASNLYYLSDDIVFYMDTFEHHFGQTTINRSNIMMIQCLFGSYKVSKAYQTKNENAEILNFSVDNTQERLLILKGIKNQKNRREKFVTIYDLKSEEIIQTIKVENLMLIGRLKSNLYNFVEGHIYFINWVIKIRYDLIDKSNGGELKENQLFDYYSNIIPLKNSNTYISSGTPHLTCAYRRLAYVIRNRREFQPDRILILPYLHDRRIYLNRHVDSNQFYTITDFQSKNFILCICINDHKIYVYTDSGILLRRLPFDDICLEHGEAQSVSENGKNFLFTKNKSSPYISLIQMDIHGLKVMYQVNYKQRFEANIKKMIGNKKKLNEKQQGIKDFWENYLLELNDLEIIQTQYSINDAGDVLIRVKPKEWFAKQRREQMKNEVFFEPEIKGKGSQEDIEQCSFFFYLPMNGNKNQEFMHFDSPNDELYDIQGVSMNESFIFFWNLGTIWSLNLKTRGIKKLSLYISEEEKQTNVKRVRCGTNKNVIEIRITQSPLKDFIIQWDLEKDKEISSFDVDSNAITFQDSQGNLYISCKDYIINCQYGCRLKSYQCNTSEFHKSKFGFQYGHRMEQNSHNWMIFRNFINLSFSYMTFVIKENFDKNSYMMQDYLFDIEGYDYVLNRNTIFTEGNLVNQDFEKLKFILKNYKLLNPLYLQSLHYPNDIGKIALHLALEAKNNRMVNLILHYMSHIKYASINLTKDIFKDLINVQNFIGYLEAVPYQTKQMQNKQSLSMDYYRDEQSEVLRCTPSRCQYVDELYFKEYMGEKTNDESLITYAVQIKSIQADWIINEQIGLQFLKELIKQNNREIFETQYVKIIIQFLYEKFSSRIKKTIMPLYFINLVSIYYMIYLQNEHRIKQHQHNEFILDIMIYVTSILSFFSFCVLAVQTFVIGITTQIYRIWGWLDLVIFLINMLILYTKMIQEIDVMTLRIYEALMIVSITLKSLYFLRLVGEIAPLVEIIIIIVYDIRYFLLIYIIALVSFVFAFYIIGQNQVQLAGDDLDLIPSYSTFLGSFKHVYLTSMGESDTDLYFDNDMTPILIFLFLMMSFFMMIHMLNMLIAIMGDSFANNNEHKEAKKNLSQLSFVVENWWINPISDKEQIVHLIAAFQVEDQDEQDEKFQKLSDKIDMVSANQVKMMQVFKDKTDELFKMQNILLSQFKDN